MHFEVRFVRVTNCRDLYLKILQRFKTMILTIGIVFQRSYAVIKLLVDLLSVMEVDGSN